MATTKLDHISHEHPLILIHDFDSSSIAAPVACSLCETPVIGISPTYTCSQEHSSCTFFVHRMCAESPTKIIHLMHPQHQLFLSKNYMREGRPFALPPSRSLVKEKDAFPSVTNSSCTVCTRKISHNFWVYSCQFCVNELYRLYKVFACQFSLCVKCAVTEPVIGHQGHLNHPLTLLRRRAIFLCDACGARTEESNSYICLPCHYWIHSSCAASPHTIKLRIHQDDTLKLIYSIPELYRRFIKHCPICRHQVEQNYWAYFCEKSGYFVHITCASGLLASGKAGIEIEEECGQTYPNLIQFPLSSTDLLVDKLLEELQSGMPTDTKSRQQSRWKFLYAALTLFFAKWMFPGFRTYGQADGQPNDTNTLQYDVDAEKENAVIYHWSHQEHPLILLEEVKNSNNSDDYDGGGGDAAAAAAADDDDDDESHANNRIDEMLICNGCIQPISITSNKHYYGCIGCNYFLHTSCANQLPLQSLPGKCPIDSEHTLKLCNYTSPLQIEYCHACSRRANGFRYECETCKENIDICCYLSPHGIKHDYHKHPLVQRRTSKKICNACLELIHSGFEYGCETCSNIQIHQSCALSFPKTISHRWDSHSISLIYPPIYYEGLRYCEKCELEVNQEAWMYRCHKCDQCFHPFCIRQPENLKFGYVIDPTTHDLHSHALTLKRMYKYQYPRRTHYSLCSKRYCYRTFFTLENQELYLECAGCNFVLCEECAHPVFPCVRQSPLLMN